MKFNVKEYNKLVQYRCFSFDDKAQDQFINYLQTVLINHNFRTTVDLYGNLIAERNVGNNDFIPLIIAHVDINQQDDATPMLVRINDWLFGFDDATGTSIGVGHDDKAGIYFALQVAKTKLDCKIIFTKDEEVGCVGTSYLEKIHFKNISFAVQLDRRGSSDVSQYTNGVNVVSKAFKENTKATLTKFGMKYVDCVYTDVGALKSVHKVDFCCINVSCGYYNEHSNKETLNIQQFTNSMQFAYEMLVLFGGSHQKHVNKVGKPTANFGWRNSKMTDWYDENNITPKKGTQNTAHWKF